jgi:hypothetical protein
MHDPLERARLGEAGRTRVKERFDVHRNVAKLARLFRSGPGDPSAEGVPTRRSG